MGDKADDKIEANDANTVSRINFLSTPNEKRTIHHILRIADLRSDAVLSGGELPDYLKEVNVYARLFNRQDGPCRLRMGQKAKECMCLHNLSRYVVVLKGIGSKSAISQLHDHDVIVNPTKEVIENIQRPEKTMEEKSRHFMKIFKPSPNGMDDKWYLTLMDEEGDVCCFAEMCTQSIVFLMGGDYVVTPRDADKSATIVVDGTEVPKYLPEFSVKSQHYPVPTCQGRAVGQRTSYGNFLIHCLKPESKAGKKRASSGGEGKGEEQMAKAYPISRFVLNTYRSSYKHNLVLLDYIQFMTDVKGHGMNQLEWQKRHGRGYEYTTKSKRGPYNCLLKQIVKLWSRKPPINAIIGDYRLLTGKRFLNCGYEIT